VERAGGTLRAGSLLRVDVPGRRVETSDGDELAWDVLVLATGGRPREGVPGALTFRGPESSTSIAEILEEAVTGRIGSLVFALPTLAAWPLPLYELALMTGIRLSDAGVSGMRLEVVTPEAAPLAVFGEPASTSIAELLETRGITLRPRTTPVVFRNRKLMVIPGTAIQADRVVALPVLDGPQIPGIEQDAGGFLRTDEYGRVDGRDDVYAAGDVTTFPIKQGGIATQQADAAAEAIAARAGARVTPRPFRPVLRGLLLTGLSPQFLAANLLRDSSEVDTEPLWWPPAKIVGRYLAPFLAEHLGLSAEPPPEVVRGVQVDVELERPDGSESSVR
jgi:sulfide:quinone oxidoreductase